ncbi:MAG: hypothetical protein JWO87_1730 [Phycisphaerales bacterium]|nr:hypothetical protein [Phycisphaerales bacterium]
MIFIFGSRLFGKCDDVAGMFHVATKFGHVNFLPLIPMQTYIVLSRNGNQFRGVPIPLSAKSILLAWARVVSLVVAVVAACIAASVANSYGGEWIVPAGVAIVAGAGFVLTMWHRSCTKAGFARACQLGQIAGLNEHGFAMLQKHYGEGTGRGFEIVPVGDPEAAAGFAPADAPQGWNGGAGNGWAPSDADSRGR